MKIQPLDERILIEPLEEKQVGMIIVPDTVKGKPVKGTVIAVGTDEALKEIIEEGDIVMFGEYAGEVIEVGSTKYLIVSRSDILAKVIEE
jgi:chaperonin GroES